MGFLLEHAAHMKDYRKRVQGNVSALVLHLLCVYFWRNSRSFNGWCSEISDYVKSPPSRKGSNKKFSLKELFSMWWSDKSFEDGWEEFSRKRMGKYDEPKYDIELYKEDAKEFCRQFVHDAVEWMYLGIKVSGSMVASKVDELASNTIFK